MKNFNSKRTQFSTKPVWIWNNDNGNTVATSELFKITVTKDACAFSAMSPQDVIQTLAPIAEKYSAFGLFHVYHSGAELNILYQGVLGSIVTDDVCELIDYLAHANKRVACRGDIYISAPLFAIKGTTFNEVVTLIKGNYPGYRHIYFTIGNKPWVYLLKGNHVIMAQVSDAILGKA